MNKTELKKILKPLIKECIKEVIFEDGTLSTVISEVVKGLGNPLTESRPLQESAPVKTTRLESDDEAKKRRQKLADRQKHLMESIGKDAYNGVNLFEGTTPAPAPQESGKGPLSGVAPSDPGVDISQFQGSSGLWKKLSGK